MFDDNQLIEELGITELTAEQQYNILDEYKMQIGEALAENLSDDQLKQFEAIVNGDQAVIDAWLSANTPDYATDPVYEELLVGYDQDPDKVPADKVYATMAWTQLNNPSLKETIATVKEKIKTNLDQYL